jgi:hypothetical protein
MQLLQELLSRQVNEEVDDIQPGDEEYIKTPPNSSSTKKKKKVPINNKAQMSLINTIWAYNNADAV